MAGSHHQAMAGVKLGLEALQKALPALEAGSKLHAAVLKAVTDISKEMAEGQGDQAGMIQQLVSLARGASQNPGAGAMERMFPPPAAGGAPPPGAMGGAA
jgi:hypothetical protein